MLFEVGGLRILMPLKDELKSGRATIGTWQQIGHPAVSKILAGRFDWVVVDMEHGIIDLEMAAVLFTAIKAKISHPLARIPINKPEWIHRVLDAGAVGVVVPTVDGLADAVRAVNHSYYPPKGRRSFAFCDANLYGRYFKEYLEQAGDVVVIVQIESAAAISNLDYILSVQGIDATMIGPYDLSGSYGVPGDMSDPRVKEAISTYKEISKQHGVPTGIHVVNGRKEGVQSAIDEGYQFIAQGMDTVFLRQRIESEP